MSSSEWPDDAPLPVGTMAVMHEPPSADHSGEWCVGDVCVVTASDDFVSDKVSQNDCPDWLNLRSGIPGIWWRGRFRPLPEDQT